MTEEKAPSDRLYDEGCPFCGGAIDGHMRAATLDGELSYCTKHKGEPWYGYAGPEYDRRKALRSPLSPPSEGPKVGETWEFLGEGTELTIDGIDDVGTFPYFGRMQDGTPVAASRKQLTKRLTHAASQDKREPKVGDVWWSDFYSPSWGELTVDRVGAHIFARGSEGSTMGTSEGGFDRDHWWPARLIRPATPSPKAEEVTLATPPRHGKSEFQRKLLEKVSGSVLVGRADPSPYPTIQKPKPDPYREHAAAVARHDPAIERVAAARLAREARYERRKAETVEAFARPLATVAVGGRFGRRVPLPGRWALAEDDEP